MSDVLLTIKDNFHRVAALDRFYRFLPSIKLRDLGKGLAIAICSMVILSDWELLRAFRSKTISTHVLRSLR